MVEETTTLACVHCGQQIRQDRFGVWYHPGTGATSVHAGRGRARDA